MCPWEMLAGNPCVCQICGKKGHGLWPVLSAVSRALGVALGRKEGRGEIRILSWRTLQSSLCLVVFCYVSVFAFHLSHYRISDCLCAPPHLYPPPQQHDHWKRQTGEGKKRKHCFMPHPWSLRGRRGGLCLSNLTFL